jgi:PAS domain S-box-containing protein
MQDKTGMIQVKRARQQESRPTIGYFAPSLVGFCQPVWSGIVDAARKRDINLICFRGSGLGDSNFSEQFNILYNLAGVENIDGVISWASMIGNYVTLDELEAFHQRYRPLPVVTMGRTLAGFPGVLMDSYEGMREAIVHLIEVHGYRRLAFIRGPEDHVYAQGRYRAYVETMESYGLALDPDLVTPPAPWGPSTGMEAMRLLLDERGLRPQTDLEAVVSVSEDALVGALQVLRARGIKIPGDVAVVGFDDTILGQTSTPPFTSVAPPYYETGHQAAETLLTLMKGGQVPQEAIVPSKLVIRRSCGCMDPTVAQAAVSVVKRPLSKGVTLGEVIRTQRARLLSYMIQAVGRHFEGVVSEWAEQLLDSFAAEMESESPGQFLSILEDILRQVKAVGREAAADLQPRPGEHPGQYIAAWHGAISALRRHVLPYVDGEALSLARNLLQQAWVMIAVAVERAQVYQMLQAEQQAQALQDLGQALITIFDMDELMDVLAEGLPRLGIPSCYLALYEEPQPYSYLQPPPQWSKLILAYDKGKRIALGAGGKRFPSHKLVPEGMLPDRQYCFVLESLCFQENQLGFALFEVGPQNGRFYDVLRGEISNALQGALLVQRVQERSVELARQNYILDTFMETVPDRIYFKDLKSRITRANHAHATRLGLGSPSEEIGKTDFDFFPEEQARPKYKQEQEIIRTGQPILGVEEFDGVGHWALTTKMPLRDEHGHIVGTFGISRDITELKRTQETLEQAYVEISTLNERLKAENLRMEAELDVTRRLQQMLLPTDEELRQIEGLDIAGFMQPADEVGGDYYDVLPHNGALKIGIGDVTGHGLESGVVMLMLQTAVRTLQTSGVEDPVYFMDILNRLLHANLQRMNVDKSMTLALLDYHMGQLRLSGQHEQLIVMRRGGEMQLIDTVDLGFPLGIESGITRFMREVPLVELEPGDGVVLYSDGITEAENEAKEFYGLERLCQVVSAHWDKPAEAIKDAVVADVREFIGQQKIYDDLTLLVVKQK